MITVKRLTGQEFAVNPDLIERVETTPDTIIVLVDGTRYVVDASMAEVVDLVRSYRASVVALSLQYAAARPVERSYRDDRDYADHVVVQLPLRPAGDPGWTP